MSFQELMVEEKLPVVAINQTSFFTHINKAFEDEYGWSAKELMGKSITEIIPSYLREAHIIGFSRFITTEQPTLLGKHLPLKILYKDGTVRSAEHYIVGQKNHGSWQFAASIVTKHDE